MALRQCLCVLRGRYSATLLEMCKLLLFECQKETGSWGGGGEMLLRDTYN